ncbi:MAG: Kazal-type serine protease inhibitor family protein [Pseudomonadota bacterium]
MLGMAVGFSQSEAANLGEACGGAAHITCNSALWCQKTTGGQCTTANAAGTCDKAPAFCMQIYRPVCGCNGKTYANDCERQKARVQLDYVGACPKPPKENEPKAVKPKSKTPKSEKK